MVKLGKDLTYKTLNRIQGVGTWSQPLFVGLYCLAVLLSIPSTLLTIGGGWLFGMTKGAIFSFVGGMLGSIIAFFLSHNFAHSWFAKRLESYPKSKLLMHAIEEEGLKMVFLTRLSPIIPFALSNYLFGLTKISFRDYLVGTLAIIPSTLVNAYIGSLLQNIDKPIKYHPLQLLLLLIGLVSISFLIRFAHKKIESKLKTLKE